MEQEAPLLQDGPQQITLDPDKAKDLKIALLERQLIQLRGQALLQEVEQAISLAAAKATQAFEAAGLDPALTYQLDFGHNTATRGGATPGPAGS